MTQEDRWNYWFERVQQYMAQHKRRPSKHRIEDHRMLNWIKYNKKQIALGKLSAERQRRFEMLMGTADKYRKLNQYAYQSPSLPLTLCFQDE